MNRVVFRRTLQVPDDGLDRPNLERGELCKCLVAQADVERVGAGETEVRESYVDVLALVCSNSQPTSTRRIIRA
jgi:hypothetical protein